MIRIKDGDGWFFPVGELRMTNVREWYTETYPTDEVGLEIVSDVTMWDVVALLNAGLGHRFYNLIGAGDSLVRERIFGRIAKIVGCDYEDVYYTWLRDGREG